MFSEMQIRHLSFTGPRKPEAVLMFGPGLNIIYGVSNTGKSSIIDSIDFILGRSRELKEIPEHEGYDQIHLGISFGVEENFTLVRALQGGGINVFDGLHISTTGMKELISLTSASKSGKSKKSFNEFILEKLGVFGKELKRNAKNDKSRLTIRSLIKLYLISESEIQKEGSPFISEQYTEKTVDKSKLKFLLTGVDDQNLVAEEKDIVRVSRTARIAMLDELIFDQQEKINRRLGEEAKEDEIEDQFERLEQSLTNLSTELSVSEGEFNQLVLGRNRVRTNLRMSKERVFEISEMLERFRLLNLQYEADIERLIGTIESGSLFSALSSKSCPLCGSEVENHKVDSDCFGDVPSIIESAKAEKSKITNLKEDLQKLIDQLRNEESELNSSIPNFEDALEKQNQKILTLSPDIKARRSSFLDLTNKKSEVSKHLGMFSQLTLYNQRKVSIEKEAPEKSESNVDPDILPTSALYDLSTVFQRMIDSWNFVSEPQVHFDKDTNDFVISGKHRVSNGKGFRAISHAAATLALLKYAQKKHTPSLGFAILDTPLLAYEKPDNPDDDLSGTEVNSKFFDYLKSWNTTQVIVIENKKSIPAKYLSGPQITYFSKIKGTGRFGLFPVE